MDPAYKRPPNFSVGTAKVAMVPVKHFSFGIPVSSILTPPTAPLAPDRSGHLTFNQV